MNKELKQLKLATIYCDGDADLVSLTHRTILAYDVDSGAKGVILVDLTDPCPKRDAIRADDRSTNSIERAAARFAGEDDGESFPGWDAIYNYLDARPELLEKTW